VQAALFEGLDDVAEGAGDFRPLQRRLVGVGRQIDDRDVQLAVNPLRRLDAVHIPFEHDVHEHQVGDGFEGGPDRLFTGGGQADDRVPEVVQPVLDVPGDYHLVLDDQHSHFVPFGLGYLLTCA
jgi:hypothetical protein